MSASQQGDKVLCFVCNNPAVKKRVWCEDCDVWSHVSCYAKKKCCDRGSTTPNPELENKDPFDGKYFAQTINALTATVSDMKNAIEQLVNENKKLRQEIESLKSDKQTSAVNTSPKSEESLIEETMERIRRSTNVIVCGLPENAQGDIRRNDTDTDINAIENLIKAAIPNDQSYRIVSVSRLGKNSSGRPRLTKVELDSPNTVNRLIRHKFGNNIYFNPDHTQLQRNQAYEVRKEFKRRKGEGEQDIRLRYHNGIPKIVSIKNQ